MKLFSIFRKKKEKEEVLEEPKEVRISPEQELHNRNIVLKHEKRINNLNAELKTIMRDEKELESNLKITKVERDKTSNRLIRRMTLIKYEVGIREELLQWL